jgi:hypothetical protein
VCDALDLEAGGVAGQALGEAKVTNFDLQQDGLAGGRERAPDDMTLLWQLTVHE